MIIGIHYTGLYKAGDLHARIGTLETKTKNRQERKKHGVHHSNLLP